MRRETVCWVSSQPRSSHHWRPASKFTQELEPLRYFMSASVIRPPALKTNVISYCSLRSQKLVQDIVIIQYVLRERRQGGKERKMLQRIAKFTCLFKNLQYSLITQRIKFKFFILTFKIILLYLSNPKPHYSMLSKCSSFSPLPLTFLSFLSLFLPFFPLSPFSFSFPYLHSST